MSLASRVLSHVSKTPQFAALADAVGTGGEIPVRGLAGSLAGCIVALLAHDRPLLVATRDADTAAAIHDDLAHLLPSEQAILFDLPQHVGDESQQHRAVFDAAVQLLAAGTRTVVATPAGIAAWLPRPDALQAAAIELKVAELYEIEELVTRLAKNGYERKQFVEGEGDFAVRGGIVDIFPFAAAQPVRAEFRDIELESMRVFDVLTQRSIRPVAELLVPLSVDLDNSAARGTIFDYIAPASLVFIDEPELVLGATEDDTLRERLSTGIAAHTRIVHSVLGGNPLAIDFHARPQPSFAGSVKEFVTDLATKAREGTTVMVLTETNEHAGRLRALLEEHDIDETTLAAEVHTLPLSSGFILPDARWGVYTEHQLFDRNRISRKPRRERFKGITLRELRRLEKGDFVVHVDKGIGRFAGMETIEVHGARQECVKLVYREGDLLYVHLNHIDRLQKYVSKEGHVPHLSKLGGAEWAKTKEKMKARASEVAQKLLAIYARRKVEKGFAFTEDSTLQQELEASFLYDDTPDQHTATEEVKRDMENTAPMDRLVCGDVGYGKTEVAVRAAFKAVQDGKQVAVLVPTTILAQQHFNTFHDRLDRFAVKVEVMSRFRSRAEQKETLGRLATGDCDVLVGTHRILSKDIAFKDLGLLIIDEEHRFGVAAKEKLREKRSTVDTLTLTATPIPRTMNMSLVGLRDISVIETPPPNRRPIQTEIIPWDGEIVRRAVMHEISRGGQVFVVHDHVQTITKLVDKLREVVPDARIAVAHGQMPPPLLEKVMMDFMLKKHDILVCTKIVESGLDLPSVNTIIINKAEKFGLAELYQLRGRVGRSNIQAYAYLIVPPLATLSTTALKRLYALEEFSELGSGFQLAMRDLELRGAGTILGGEQSGFIDALGFELYNQLLEEAVRELKATEFKEIFKEEKVEPTLLRRDVQVQVASDALIPSSYVPDDTERFDIYKRLYRADTEGELQKVHDELLDRFGPLPLPAEALFSAVRLKNAAGAIGFDKVTEHQHDLVFELSASDPQTDLFYLKHFDALMTYVTAHPQSVALSTKGNTLRVKVQLDDRTPIEVAEEIRAAIVPKGD